MVIVPNTLGKAIRVVEFFANEIERDQLIVAWQVYEDAGYAPVVLGGLPEGDWCYFVNSAGEDYSANATGRWILPDGETFTSIVAVRQHFETFAQVQEQDIADAPVTSAPQSNVPLRPHTLPPLPDMPKKASVYRRSIPNTCSQ